MPYDDIIEKHANRVGIDPTIMKRIMRIESGGNAGNQTGSYKGLFQLSDREFRAGGGTGTPFDPEQNTMAAANKIAREALQFKQAHGRDPTGKDIYMIHQQGAAGYDAHMANPEGTAWQNVRRYYGSDAMAKKAIWGNIPDNLKSQYGSVDNVKSSDLTGIYGAKMEGSGTVTPTQWAGHRKAKGEDVPQSRGLGQEDTDKTAEQLRAATLMTEADVPKYTGMRVPDLVPEFELRRVS